MKSKNEIEHKIAALENNIKHLEDYIKNDSSGREMRPYQDTVKDYNKMIDLLRWIIED